MTAESLVGPGFAVQVLGLSVVAGLVGSLLGLGGGVVLIPGLTLLLGVEIRWAAGASLVAVVAASSAAAAFQVRDRVTNLRLAMLLEVATAAGALSGAVLAGWVSTRALHLIFAGALVWSVLAMARGRGEAAPEAVAEHPWAARLGLFGSYPDPSLGREVGYVVARLPLGFGLMYGAGVLSGLLGIGGGALKVPAMDRVLRLPVKVSTATSNFMIGVTAAGGAWIYFARGEIPPLLAAPVVLGVLVGSAAGARLSARLDASVLKTVLVVVLSFSALQLVIRGLAPGQP